MKLSRIVSPLALATLAGVSGTLFAQNAPVAAATLPTASKGTEAGSAAVRTARPAAATTGAAAGRSEHLFGGMTVTAGQIAPLVLDLKGDGKFRMAPKPVRFDAYGTGEAIPLNWPDGALAFLALDLNANGAIDSGLELFGDGTVLLSEPEQTAEHAFFALIQYDENHDGKITSQDKVFPRLLLWQDRNLDGLSASAEISTLSAHDIVALNLGFRPVAEPTRDLSVMRLGSYERGGKQLRIMADLNLSILDE